MQITFQLECKNPRIMQLLYILLHNFMTFYTVLLHETVNTSFLIFLLPLLQIELHKLTLFQFNQQLMSLFYVLIFASHRNLREILLALFLHM